MEQSKVMGSRLDGVFTVYTYSTFIKLYFYYKTIFANITFKGCSENNVIVLILIEPLLTYKMWK